MYLEFFYCNDLLYFCLIEEKAEMCCFIVGFIKSIIKLHILSYEIFICTEVLCLFLWFLQQFFFRVPINAQA